MRGSIALALAALASSALVAGMSRAVPLAGPNVIGAGTGVGMDAPLFGGRVNGPLGGVISPETYRLGPGDGLVLNVWGPISMTVPLEVGPDGTTFVPGRGSISLSDVTLAEAARRIEELMRSQYRNVNVEVRLQRVRTFLIYRTGEVRQAGPVLAQGSSRVVDLLPDSVLTAASSRRNIVVRHRDGAAYTYDLQRLLLVGTLQTSGMLDGDDVIYVPRATTQIGAWGGVTRPGQFELGPRDSLSTLLDLAGGLRPAANRDRALFVRWAAPSLPESLWVSLDDVETHAYDPPLRDGDNLYVSFDPEYHEFHQVTVVGQVRRAGDYPIQLGKTRLTEVIDAAGGFRPLADLSAIRLIRSRPDRVGRDVEFERLSRLSREEMTESEYESFQTQLAALRPDFRIEWARVLRSDVAMNPLLFDGDIIRVDRATHTVRVDGQVRRPGVFEHVAGRRVREYVQLAGGFTERAARTRVRVTRAVNGQSVRARDAQDIAPGDFVWVPERPDKTTWAKLRDLMTVAAQVATVVIAVRR